MTKEEIKALIATAIAGQGTNVDGGGQLPNILNAIVDAIPEGGGSEPLIYDGEILYNDVDFNRTVGIIGNSDFIMLKEAFLSGRPVMINFRGSNFLVISSLKVGAISELSADEYPGLGTDEIWTGNPSSVSIIIPQNPE